MRVLLTYDLFDPRILVTGSDEEQQRVGADELVLGNRDDEALGTAAVVAFAGDAELRLRAPEEMHPLLHPLVVLAMGGLVQSQMSIPATDRLSLAPRGRPVTPASAMSVRERRLATVVREEVRRLTTWSERHRRLLARLLIALGLSVVVDLVGSLVAWHYESGSKGSDIHGFGDAVFFSTVQLLTVSSSFKNPVTGAGKLLDIGLEAWAIFVVTAVAGSFAAFFQTGDSA